MAAATTATATVYHSGLQTVAQDTYNGAKAYDKLRPTYPLECVDALLTKLKVAGKPGARIVDVGAGTGKLTELVARRSENFHIKAVEPHDGMLAKLAEKGLPGVEAVSGNGEEMPIETGWADAIVIATAFHWFATPEALAELHRILKPGGVMGMIWNIPDFGKPVSWKATTAWEQKLNEFYLTLEDVTPRFSTMAWKNVFEEQPLDAPMFNRSLGEADVSYVERTKPETIWSRLETMCQIQALKGDEFTTAKETFFNAFEMDDVDRNEKGEAAVHYKTYFSWTERQ